MIAASMNATSTAGPALGTASPRMTKMPVPTSRAHREQRERHQAHRALELAATGLGVAAAATMSSTDLVRNRPVITDSDTMPPRTRHRRVPRWLT